jgi:hypothetical protein
VTADRRSGAFPTHEDIVRCDDGSTWLYLEDCPGELPVTGRWEQLDPQLSEAELLEEQRLEHEQRARLLLALRVWERAMGACSFMRVPGPDIRATDPLPTFVELIARAALTDCIAESCDGAPLGMLHHTIKQVEGLLNPSAHRRVLAMLNRHLALTRAPLLSAPFAGG